MSQETKRWRGLVVGAVCAILALGVLYCLKSGERGKGTPPGPVSQPTNRREAVQTESPSPSPSPAFLPTQLVTRTDTTSASISGTVRFADSNEPASGTLVQMPFNNPNMATLTTHSDQCGSYTLTGVPPGGILWVSAGDPQIELYSFGQKISRPLTPGEKRTGVNLTVYKGRKGAISGKVVGTRLYFDPTHYNPRDIGENWLPYNENYQKKEITPLAGVKIRLRESADSAEETETNETGEYRFENLRIGGYWVELSCPPEVRSNQKEYRFPITLKNVPRTDIHFEIQQDSVAVTGRVTDADGKPVQEARVSILGRPDETRMVYRTDRISSEFSGSPNKDSLTQPRDRFENTPERPIPLEAVTDSDGRYLLCNLGPSHYRSVAQCLVGGAPEYRRRGFSVVCVKAEGYSPSHQRVETSLTENMVRQALEYLEVVVKNAENLERAPRPLDDSEWNLPQSEGDVITGIDFVLQKDASLSGYLVDSEGKSVMENTSLGVKRIQLVGTDGPIALPEFEEKDLVKPLSVDLTPEGRFEFSSVPVGTFRFKTLGEQGASLPFQTKPESLTIKPGDKIENLRVEVETYNLQPLDIEVLDSKTHEPVEVFSCSLEITSLPGERNKHQIYPNSGLNFENRVHKDGKVHFDLVPPGPAKLYVNVAGNERYYPLHSFDIEIKKGQNELPPILLVPMGEIIGKVQESTSGKPMSEFIIRIDGGDQNLKKSPDNPGSFQIKGVSPGQKKLEVSAEGYGVQFMEIEVQPGEAAELTASLKPEGRLIGRITCEGKVVSYEISTRFQKPSPNYLEPGEVRKDGTFECKGLGEGTYDVIAGCNLSDPNGIEYSVRQYDSFSIKAGEEVRKDFHFPENAGISGKIEFPDTVEKVRIGVCNDQPAPDAPGENLLISMLETRQNRIPYEIRYLPPGTCSIIVFYTDDTGEHRMSPKTVTLQPGRIETVDLTD